MVQVPRLVPLRPFTRREYEFMVEKGFFHGEQVELLRGFLVEMSPIGTRHAEAVRRLGELLWQAMRGRARVSVQSPFAVADHSEPEPDLALIPPDDFSSQHPSRAFLIVEVADTSLDYDRAEKAALYASADVTEYWIVNLLDDVVEVHRDPDPRGSWRSVTTIGRGGSIAPTSFPDGVLAIDDLIPAR